MAAAVFATSPMGAIMISEGRAPARPIKLPGGHYEEQDIVPDPVETARRAAKREFKEETGIDVPVERFRYIFKEERPDNRFGAHDFYFFTVVVTKEEVEGRGEPEQKMTVHILSNSELREKARKIVQPHRALLDKFNLWP